MIFFFDRSISREVPRALRSVGFPHNVEAHDDYFDHATPDEEWLRYVGSNEWLVVGRDYRHHERSAELAAIRQYGVGCFYLWGAEEPLWRVFQCFMRGADNIIRRAEVEPRPFVFRVHRHGGVMQVYV